MFIFLFILFSYVELGMLTTLALLFSMIFTFLIGKLANKHSKLIYRLGSVINAVAWTVRTFIRTNMQLFVTDSIYGCSKTMYLIPFDASDYDKANRKKHIVKHIIYRESLISAGFVIIFLVLLLISNLKVGLYIGSAASLLLLLF